MKRFKDSRPEKLQMIETRHWIQSVITLLTSRSLEIVPYNPLFLAQINYVSDNTTNSFTINLNGQLKSVYNPRIAQIYKNAIDNQLYNVSSV